MDLTPLNAKYAKTQNPKLKWSFYDCNMRTALQIRNENGETVCQASVNLPSVLINEDEIAIKDYSENEGILRWLIENKIVADPHVYVRSGYVQIPICKLLVKPT